MFTKHQVVELLISRICEAWPIDIEHQGLLDLIIALAWNDERVLLEHLLELACQSYGFQIPQIEIPRIALLMCETATIVKQIA